MFYAYFFFTYLEESIHSLTSIPMKKQSNDLLKCYFTFSPILYIVCLYFLYHGDCARFFS